MPQNRPVIAIQPVNTSGLQAPISLGVGNMAQIGNPGGPVVFANYGATLVTAFSGSFPGSVVGGH